MYQNCKEFQFTLTENALFQYEKVIKCINCDYENGYYAFYNIVIQEISECKNCEDKIKNCLRCKNEYNIAQTKYTNSIVCNECISQFGKYVLEDNTIVTPGSSGVQDPNYPFYCCNLKCGECQIDVKKQSFLVAQVSDLAAFSKCLSCANYRQNNPPSCECLPGMYESPRKSQCTIQNESCGRDTQSESYVGVARLKECCFASNCEKCNEKPDVCTTCKQSDMKLRGPPPSCACLEGSYLHTVRIGADDVPTGACIECPPGTYSFKVNSKQCLECPQEVFNCKGGSQMELQKGYWRSHAFSTDYEKCVRQQELESCIGGSDGGDAICKKGYVGALCEVCDIDGVYWKDNYTPNLNFQCETCQNMTNINRIRIIGILIFQFFVMYMTVGGTIFAIQDKLKYKSLEILFNTHEPTTDEQGILMKILNGYFYLLGIIALFWIEVPAGVNQYWRMLSNPSKAMANSFDCFFKDISKGAEGLNIPTTHFQIFGQLFLSIIQVIIVLIAYLILQKLRIIKGHKKTFIWTLFIYQFFTIESTIIEMLIETIACKKVLGKLYMVADSSFECYTDDYNTFSLGINIPLLIIFVGVIPLATYWGLRRTAYQALKKKDSRLSYRQMQTLSNNLNKIEQNKTTQNVFPDGSPQNLENSNSFLNLNKNDETNNNVEIVEDSGDDKENKRLFQEEENQIRQEEKYASFESAHPLQKFGFLYLEYKPQVYFWELIKIYQRNLIATVMAFYYKKHNRLDLESTIIVAVTIILGLFIANNPYGYLFVIGITLLGIINMQFVLNILRKVVLVFARNIVIQANDIQQMQDEYQEQRELLQEKEEIQIKNKHLNPSSPAFILNQQKIEEINIELNDFTYQLGLSDDALIQKDQKASVKCFSLIMKYWVQCMEYCGSFLCGYPTRNAARAIKKMNKKIKHFAYYCFVLGVESQQISLTKEITPNKKFNSAQVLSGQLTEEQKVELVHKNEVFFQQRLNNTRELLQELAYKFAYHLKEMKMPAEYWKDTLIKRNPDFILDEEKQISKQKNKIQPDVLDQENQCSQQIDIQANDPKNQSQLPIIGGHDEMENKDDIVMDQEVDQNRDDFLSKNSNQFACPAKQDESMSKIQDSNNKCNDQIELVKPVSNSIINKLFKQLDKQEIMAHYEAFILLGINNNGKLTIDSLSVVLKELGQKITYKELSQVIKQVDADGIRY